MGPCGNLSEVRAFLGTIGVVRIFIRDFALRANPLVKLTHKDAPFKFGSDQIKAQEDLKTALIESLTLRAINYMSHSPRNQLYVPLTRHTCSRHVLHSSRIPPLPMR